MYKVIVVGTDGSPTADKAVQSAADLARSLGAELHIVTAVKAPRPGMAAASGAPLVDPGIGQALAAEVAQSVGETAVQKFGEGIKAEAHAAQGNPDDVILATAADVGADLIVVGSKGMRGARRYLGSVPNSVAHSATAPCSSSRPTESARLCVGGSAQLSSWMRTMFPAGSRKAQSRIPYGCSVGSWTTSALIAWRCSKVPSRSLVANRIHP